MWNFRQLGEGEPERSPHEAEFFNVGNLDWAAAVVRESIQNSLDAKLPSSNSVHVRFSLKKEPVSKFLEYFSELIPHVQSCGFSFDIKSKKDFKYLIIEDFGTRGLDGPITRNELQSEGKSNYYNFWWREGISLKEGREAGRWGLGKTVFFISSELRSFWGYTIRNNDQRELLLGKALLKSHRLDNRQFDYYAYYSVEDNQPIETQKPINYFKNSYNLSRKNEPGLSIVIPFPVEDITSDAIIRAIIQHYFYAIIKGILTVEVSDNSHTFTLNRQSIFELAKNQNWQDTSWENHSVESLLYFVYNSVNSGENNLIKLEECLGIPKMSDSLFGNNLEYLRTLFNDNKLVSLQIPLKIEPIGQNPQNTFFNAYIQKDENIGKTEEFYIRSGILISEIKMVRANVRALLTAEDEAVAKFLGDSESPAHTDWKERTESFKQKYKSSRDTLRFIRSSLRDLIKILDIPPPGIDPDFLKDIFNIPAEVGNTLGDRPSDEFMPESFLKSDTFNVQQIKGGFKISLSKKDDFKPFRAQLEVAYNTKRGNPFSKYDFWDFELSTERKGTNSIVPEISGGRITRIIDNAMLLSIKEQDFSLKITGFDPNRELVISLK